VSVRSGCDLNPRPISPKGHGDDIRDMDALVYGLASVAAVIAGVVFGDITEPSVKRTARRWWQSMSGKRENPGQDKNG